MEEEVIIEYMRTKSEAEKIYFRRLWLKQMILNIVLGIVLLPCWIMLGMSFGVSLDHGLGLEGKTSGFLSIIMILFILNFFFSPVYKLYSLYKKQIKIIHETNNIQFNKFLFTKEKFKNENEISCIEAPWSNTKCLMIDKDYIMFQLKVPIVFFFIPTGNVSTEVKNILIKTIPKN